LARKKPICCLAALLLRRTRRGDLWIAPAVIYIETSPFWLIDQTGPLVARAWDPLAIGERLYLQNQLETNTFQIET
jgi:hypothetical protein